MTKKGGRKKLVKRKVYLHLEKKYGGWRHEIVVTWIQLSALLCLSH